MSREKNLAKNTLILSLGTFLPKLTSLITLPIVTAGLTKSEYGTYDLVTTLVGLFLPVVTLQLQAAAFRFLIDCRNEKEKTDSIISNVILFSSSMSIIALLILFFALGSMGVTARLLICLYFFVDILMVTMQQIVRGLSYNNLYSISTLIQSVSNMLLVVYTISLKGYGLHGILLSVLLATLLSVIFLIWKGHIFQHFKFRYFSWEQIKSMLAYSWPMIPNSLSNWILSFSDRAVLTIFMGLEATALYAAANKIPILFTTIQSTFILAWQENASIVVGDKDSDTYYTKIFDVVFRMLCGIMAILISFSPALFSILIRGNYSESYSQMPILFMALLFSAGASFLGGVYVAHKKTKSVGLTTIIAAAINLIICLLGVKKIGLFAASLSTLVSYLFLFVYRMFNVKKIQPIRYEYGKIILFVFILVGMCILFWINTATLNIVNAMVAITFALIINRKLLASIIIMIKNKIRKA